MILEKLKDYFILMRMHSLSGAWLLLLPSFWSIAYNSTFFSAEANIYYLLFAIGAILMRAFGCIINDLADINIDKKVARTKTRPLASGKVVKKEAYILLVILIIIPFIIFLSFNNFAKLVALLSLIFVVFYPFSKRFFYAPQLVLGITFSWGILLADAVFNQSIGVVSILMYIASIFWTLGYDTVYAYQDYQDDKKIGVKSLTLLLGENPRIMISLFYFIMLILMIIVGFLGKQNIYYYVLVIGGILFVIIKALKMNYFNSNNCFEFFKINVALGFIIWVSIIIG